MRSFTRARTLALLGLLWVFAAVPALCASDDPALERIIAAGREDNRVMQHLDDLCNRIGPRLTGSDNLQNACAWARERFEEFGLHDARLESWGEFPVGFNRGPWFGRMVEPEDRPLCFGTGAWTAGTRGVVRGRAVFEPEDEVELEAVRSRLAGAWVFAKAARRGGPQPDEAFRMDREAAYAEEGIAGIVRPSRDGLIVTGGNYRIAWDKLPTIPSITLLRTQWDQVAERLGSGEPVVLEFDIRNHFRKGPIPLYNVVADIPGEERPEEYVIVGGHIDSWDGATGATDNGTGCATTLEAARLLMKAHVRPRRTIRFMLWSGEEQGMLGSRAYTRAHPELMPRISAVLVHDWGTNPISGIAATRAMRDDFEEVFRPVFSLDPAMPFAIREVDGLRGFGSDHDSFLHAGVPAFFWDQSGRADYRRTHHTQFDTYDAAVPEYQRHSSLVVALAAYGIANLDHLLPRENLVARDNGARRRGERSE